MCLVLAIGHPSRYLRDEHDALRPRYIVLCGFYPHMFSSPVGIQFRCPLRVHRLALACCEPTGMQCKNNCNNREIILISRKNRTSSDNSTYLNKTHKAILSTEIVDKSECHRDSKLALLHSSA